MNNRESYSYSILRYVHDPSSGEFINVGVAIHSPRLGFFDIKIRTTLGRITETFPGVNGAGLRFLLRSINNKFLLISSVYKSPLNFGDKASSLEEIIHSVLPRDDSSLIWSDIHSGLSNSPAQTLEKLFARYVTKYDQKKHKSRKTDEDLIRGFKKDLENRQLSDFFNEKVISTNVDDVKFPFAWKNGIWHCIEPISFDLSAPESIREKAHKYLGQITSANQSSEKFKIYLLVSKPQASGLESAFNKALGILQMMPVTSEVYYEEDKSVLLNKLTSQINAHEVESAH